MQTVNLNAHLEYDTAVSANFFIYKSQYSVPSSLDLLGPMDDSSTLLFRPEPALGAKGVYPVEMHWHLPNLDPWTRITNMSAGCFS